MSTVRYAVSLEPHAQTARVDVSITGIPSGAPLRFAIPTWVPGAYAFMRYARAVHSLKAVGADGREHAVLRDGWTGWRVDSAPADVMLSYALNLADSAFSELVGYIQHDQAVFMGTGLVKVLHHEGPVQVTWNLPAGFHLHVPDGPSASGSTFTFKDFAEVQDSPVCLGAFETRTRELHGVPFRFVFMNRALGFDDEVERWMDDCMKIAGECHGMFGGFPFKAYSFMVSFSPDHHWGLEHRASTMIGVGADVFIDPRERMSSLRLVAHELFHAWNVCSMRPRELVKIDEVGGNFTDGLWVAEGVTRYHEYLLCVRAGVMDPRELFSNVVNYWKALEPMPAYRRASPADSSRATFLNHHRYPGMLNTAVDYYDVGMLVAFDLDAALVAHAGTALPEVFGRFYAAFREKGFTHDEATAFYRDVHERAGLVMANEVQRAGMLTVEEKLHELGFTVSHREVPFIGITLVENKGPRTWNILDTGAAAAAGVASGDTLTEVDGVPFSLKALKWAVARNRPLALRVLRGGTYHLFTVTPRMRREVTGLTWSGTDVQLGRLRKWLKREDLAPASGEKFPLTWHDNFHGIQDLI